MDAPEEDLDIKLQRISGDLLTDFDQSLTSFLRKAHATDLGSRVRWRVRTRDTTRLISLLEPFQELPQLLDPHLQRWIPLLGEAMLEFLRADVRRGRAEAASSKPSDLLMPVSAAICKLLYTLCKIRGEKVVVRFLSVETRNLELLLSALEQAEAAPRGEDDGAVPPTAPAAEEVPSAAPWPWEERYVVLLWLSHLLLAPFDLSSISSQDVEDGRQPDIQGLDWPADLPGIALRLLPLGIKYLASPGREREAAKALLVRIAMRKDMQELGLLGRLVQWALSTLRPETQMVEQTAYFYIGRLSFLSGILAASSDTSEMDPYLDETYRAIHGVSSSSEPRFQVIVSSAVARKTMIKVVRSVAVLVLRNGGRGLASTDVVETTIGYLLDALADNDTPVRLAASKALSVITLKLEADMAAQVVEAVLQGLKRNVLWTKGGSGSPSGRTRDLQSVNALEWHGLMLTLSHLLYRRSPPAETLADIVQALLMGLAFEQRNSAGGSVGSNVRDAACFGIWALARRYLTTELLAVPGQPSGPSTVQMLGTALVVTACLDPAGNIRRGASAALQELIGRHPDMVEKGIWVVQTVDYHAVALRARAVGQVALDATKLSDQYGEAILLGLLGWRGVGDADAAARRAAGASFGAISSALSLRAADPVVRLSGSFQALFRHLNALSDRQVEERHGVILALAAALDHLPLLTRQETTSDKERAPTAAMRGLLASVVDGFQTILQKDSAPSARRPDLTCEAVSQLILSMFPVFQAVLLGDTAIGDPPSPFALTSGAHFVSGASTSDITAMVAALGSSSDDERSRLRPLMPMMAESLSHGFLRTEQEAIVALSRAVPVVLALYDSQERESAINAWTEHAHFRQSTKSGVSKAYFFAMVMSHRVLSTLDERDKYNTMICSALLERWASDSEIATRVAILECLTQSQLLLDNTGLFVPMISEGLDDYTTNSRGDVGSHVRLQALRMVKSLWTAVGAPEPGTSSGRQVLLALFHQVLRLAVEKLDRVRAEAQAALALALPPSYAAQLMGSTFSSQTYFALVLDLFSDRDMHRSAALEEAFTGDSRQALMQQLLAGYVTSADTGNEDLVVASRAALAAFCEQSQQGLDAVCTALAQNLRRRTGEDRVVVPTLEVVAFLFYAGGFARCRGVDYRALCLAVQRAHYKTGNVRKIEACIRVYGALAAPPATAEDAPVLAPPARKGGAAAAAAAEAAADVDEGHARAAAATEARRRLGALLFHPWPRVRSMVIDELWGLVALAPGGSITSNSAGRDRAAGERLKGVDWGTAGKDAIRRLVGWLQLEG